MPGRLISDNILAAYEILHPMVMKRLGRQGSFVLKLDMSKTFDRVKWSFFKSNAQENGLFEGMGSNGHEMC